MKLIISENQYRRLLEVKHSTLLNEYENVDLGVGYENLVPEFGNLLTHLSTLSLQNNTNTPVEVKSGKEIVVDTNKEELLKSLKDYIEGSRIDWETSEDNGKLTIKYTKKILPVVSSDEEEDVEYEREEIVYDESDFDEIRKQINNEVYNVDEKYLTDEVKKIMKDKYPNIYRKIIGKRNSDKIFRYCFYHYHRGIDVGGKLGSKLYFKKPFTVEYIGNECFVLKDDDGYYHRFCHCKDKNIKNGKRYDKGYNFASVGNMGSSTSPHVHYEFGDGMGSGGKLTGHINPKNYWKNYFYGDNLRKPSYTFGRRNPINSLCRKYYR